MGGLPWRRELIVPSFFPFARGKVLLFILGRSFRDNFIHFVAENESGMSSSSQRVKGDDRRATTIGRPENDDVDEFDIQVSTSRMIRPSFLYMFRSNSLFNFT